MQTSFRPAGPADLETLMPLFAEFYATDGDIVYDAPRLRPAVEELLSNDGLGRIFLIEEDDRLLGYLVVAFGYSLEFHGRDAFIDELYVREAARGRGIGAEAIETAARYCRSRNVRALHLEVDFRNEKARRLYVRSGFVDHERHLMTRKL